MLSEARPRDYDATVNVSVQKFGGSSVGTPERIRRVAEIVGARKREGSDVIVVVSAMGDTTDDLLQLASRITSQPNRRELDMLLTAGERISMALLSMALHAEGLDAISFTGSQSGIITDESHTRARILEVRPHRIAEELARGRIVIVAGFQGVSLKKEITTLGRGGSDTTAVALAGAFHASECEILSDVPGVLTADPRRVPGARTIPRIPSDVMLEMASLGAQVLNPRSVSLARRLGVPIVARSSFTDGPVTRVEGESRMESKEVMAVAIEEKVLLLRVSGSRGGSRDGSRDLIGTLAKIGLDVLQAREDGTDGSGMTLVLRASDPVLMLERARGALGDGRDAKIASGYGLVSVVGSGLLNDPALWARIARALGNADIHPETVFYSPLSIGLVIGKDRVEEAVRLLHAEFLEAKA